MEFLKIILTALLSAAALFLITKCMGHKQVAQLDFFDYISGITIGSIAAELAADLESPWKSLTALVIYGIVSAVLQLLTAKFPSDRIYLLIRTIPVCGTGMRTMEPAFIFISPS